MALDDKDRALLQPKKRGRKPGPELTPEEKAERRRIANRKYMKENPGLMKAVRFSPEILAILESHVARKQSTMSAIIKEAILEYNHLYPLTD